jgi:hypothetical protein
MAGCSAVRGCVETHAVVSHIKTCVVGKDFHCATKGCDSARKLIAHYRQCRDRRIAASAGKPYHCLICSLLAREVKQFQTAVKEKRGGYKSALSPVNMMYSKSGIAASVGFGNNNNGKNNYYSNNNNYEMPPPPPRRPSGGGLLGKDSNFGSPTIPEHMRKKVSTVAGVVRDSRLVGNPAMLGKSYDSSSATLQMMRGRYGYRSDSDEKASSDEDTDADEQGSRSHKRERSVSVGDVLDVMPSPARNVPKKSVITQENDAYDNWTNRHQSATVSSSPSPVFHYNRPPPPQLARRRSSSCSVIRGGGFASIPEGDHEEYEDSSDAASSRASSFRSDSGAAFSQFECDQQGDGEDVDMME